MPVFGVGAFNGGGNCCCPTPTVPNWYRWPAPVRPAQKVLSARQLTIHTDKNVIPSCVPGRCCEPEPVIVKEAKKSFIITACIDCLSAGLYYTLVVDRAVPFEAFGLDTYINVVPESFVRGEVGLVYTEIEHATRRGVGNLFDNEQDRIGSVEVDGEHTYDHGHGHGGDLHHSDGFFDGGMHGHGFGGAHGIGAHRPFGCAGGIPVDPAFPGVGGRVGTGFRTSGILAPVVLDLHGNIATGKNFATDRVFNGTGYPPYSNRYSLFYNNTGSFVLSRPWTRRTDYL